MKGKLFSGRFFIVTTSYDSVPQKKKKKKGQKKATLYTEMCSVRIEFPRIVQYERIIEC